jgi:hypothetical protein
VSVWLVENKFAVNGVEVDWYPMQTAAWKERSHAEQCVERLIESGVRGAFRVVEYAPKQNDTAYVVDDITHAGKQILIESASDVR